MEVRQGHVFYGRLAFVALLSLVLFLGAKVDLASASGGGQIALIVDLDTEKNLANSNDYAGYGGMQLLTQLGLAFEVEPTASLASAESLSQYKAVINPGSTLTAGQKEAVLNFVSAGGIFLSGGLTTDYPEAGVQVVGTLSATVPAIAGDFTHDSTHPIIASVHKAGLPVLLPPGTDSYGLLRATAQASGLGSVSSGTQSGDAVVVTPYGKGVFVIFGTNPFATVGYGMGMATEPTEQHYPFPKHPQELHKVFNWETARSIKERYITEDNTDLVWADEHGRTVLRALLWAFAQQETPVVWEWYWPYMKEFAASLQHDWDSGSGFDAQVLREAEKKWGVKSALYVLIPRMKDPNEARVWYNEGWEVGLHSDKDPAPSGFQRKMMEDMLTISWRTGALVEELAGVVHHYVRFYKEAPLWWEELGFAYDASWYDMDWKQVFFTGTSRPFFVKHDNRILPVLELPSRNSEGVQKANNGAYYLGQPDLQLAIRRLERYVDQIANHHGHASMNVHPNAAAGHVEYERGYVTYIKGLEGHTDKNAWFARPIDVAQWYRARSEVVLSQVWDGGHLRITLSTDEVTTPLPLEGYTLLIPAHVGTQPLARVQIDGATVTPEIVEREGQNFAALVLTVNGEHVITADFGQ